MRYLSLFLSYTAFCLFILGVVAVTVWRIFHQCMYGLCTCSHRPSALMTVTVSRHLYSCNTHHRSHQQSRHLIIQCIITELIMHYVKILAMYYNGRISINQKHSRLDGWSSSSKCASTCNWRRSAFSITWLHTGQTWHINGKYSPDDTCDCAGSLFANTQNIIKWNYSWDAALVCIDGIIFLIKQQLSHDTVSHDTLCVIAVDYVCNCDFLFT